MPLIAQICMIVVTITLALMAVMAIRLMLQTKALLEHANRSLAGLPALIEEVQRISARADELLAAFSKITRSASAAVSRAESFAERSTTMAFTLLDEVEGPISRAAGLIRGIRTGADHLLHRWKSRVSRSPSDRDDDAVVEERWMDDGGGLPESGTQGLTGPNFRSNGR